MRIRTVLRLFIFLQLTPLFIRAQDSTLVLDNVVVTANLVAQSQKESGRNILTIKGNEIAALPVHSLDELLRYLPGIEIQQRGPQGTQSDITIRGGTFQQVLVIIDGVRINDPLTGHFNMYIPVHPGDIERIEILKGAASAIWGAEAVGGVVNILTKSFSERAQKNELRGKLQAGNYGLLNGEIYASHTQKKSHLTAGILSNNADGQLLRGTKSYFNLHTAHLSFTRLLARQWRVAFRGAGDFRRFNAQNFYTGFTSDTARERINSTWWQASLQKKYATGTLQTDIAWKSLRDQYWFRPSAVPNDNRSGLLSAQLFYTGVWKAKSGYTAGLQLIQKNIRSNDRGNHSLWHGAGYFILRHKPAAGLSVSESLRIDRDESYGWILVPQLNIAWSLNRFTIRGTAGRSFRDADFTERYNNYNKPTVSSGRIGNPALEAEHSWNFEAGIDYLVTSRLSLRSTFFYRDHRNLIDWANKLYAEMPRQVNLVPGGTYQLALNVEKIRTRGLELDMQYTGKTGTRSHLLTMAGITWLHSSNEDPVPSLYISSHARLLFNLTATWTINNFTISINGLYKERAAQKSAALNTQLMPSYALCNMKTALSLPHLRGKLFLQADNLFNKKYTDLLGSDMPGRWLSGGIEIAL